MCCCFLQKYYFNFIWKYEAKIYPCYYGFLVQSNCWLRRVWSKRSFNWKLMKSMNALSKWNIINNISDTVRFHYVCNLSLVVVVAACSMTINDKKGVNFWKTISLEIILMLKSTQACIHEQNMRDCNRSSKLTRNSSDCLWVFVRVLYAIQFVLHYGMQCNALQSSVNVDI